VHPAYRDLEALLGVITGKPVFMRDPARLSRGLSESRSIAPLRAGQ
jgi:hypothetical protein